MKLMNFIIFILVMNMMCGVVAAIPDNTVAPVNENRNLFSDADLQTDENVYDESKYGATGGDDKSTDYQSVFGKSFSWARTNFMRLYRVMFGLPHLVKQALPGSADSGPVGLITNGLFIITAGMWLLLIVWIFRGAVIE